MISGEWPKTERLFSHLKEPKVSIHIIGFGNDPSIQSEKRVSFFSGRNKKILGEEAGNGN
jgi:hypothetical protein